MDILGSVIGTITNETELNPDVESFLNGNF